MIVASATPAMAVCTQLSLVQPQGGEHISGTYQIQFSRDDCNEDVAVKWAKLSDTGDPDCASVNSWNDLISVSPPGTSANWNTIPLLDGVDYCVRISDATGLNAEARSNVFEIDNTPPPAPASITMTDPVNVVNEADVHVTGDAAGEPDGVTVTCTVDDSNGATAAVTNSASAASDAFDVSLDVSSLDDGTLTAECYITDLAGNIGPVQTTTATKETVVPTLDYVWVRCNGTMLFPNHTNAGGTFVITFDPSEDLGKDPLVTIDGSPADSVTWAGYEYKAWRAMPAGSTEGNITFTIDFEDINGNPGVTVVDVTDDSFCTYDETPFVPSDIHIESTNSNPNYAKIGDNITLTGKTDEKILGYVNISARPADYTGYLGVSGGYHHYIAVSNTSAGDPQGLVLFNVSAWDWAGNYLYLDNSAITDGSFVIFDSLAPVMQTAIALTDPVNTGNQADVHMTGDAAGEPDGAVINCSIDDGATTIVQHGAAASDAFDITFDASALNDGLVNGSCYVIDLAGNVGPVRYTSAWKDTVIPTLTEVTIHSDNAKDSALAKQGDTVTINFTSSEAVTSVQVNIDGNAADSITNIFGDTYIATRAMQPSDTEGPVSFAVNFEDLNGNPGVQVTTTTDGSSVTYDETLPLIQNVVINPADPSNNNQPVLTFDVVDAVSGVDLAFISVNDHTNAQFTDSDGWLACAAAGKDYSCTLTYDGATQLPDGDYNIDIDSQDLAGNDAAMYNIAAYTVDTAAPTTSDDYAGTGWQTFSPVQVTITESDPAPSSGISWTSYCIDQADTCVPGTDITGGATVDVASEGINYLRYHSGDNAGNIQAVQSTQIMIDTAVPVITNVVINPADPSNNNQPVLTFTVSDATSGVNSSTISVDDTQNIFADGDGDLACADMGAGLQYDCTLTYDAGVELPDSDYDITIDSSDNAANPASTYTITAYTVDTQFPTSFDDAGAIDGVWVTSVPTVTITWDDPVPSSGQDWIMHCTGAGCDPSAGTAGTSYSSFGEGTTIFRWASADLAGNVQATTERTIMVDTVPPYVAGGPVPVDGAIVNDVSQVCSIDLADDTSGIDNTTITITVEGTGYVFGADPEVSWDGLTATFTPAVPWTDGQTVDCSADVSDVAGNAMTTESWSFLVDITPPESWAVEVNPNDPQQGDIVQVTGRLQDANNVLDAQLLIDDGATATIDLDPAHASNSFAANSEIITYSLDTTSLAEGTHSVTLLGWDGINWEVADQDNTDSFVVNAAPDTIAPSGTVTASADTVNSDYYTVSGTLTADADDVIVTINDGASDVGTVVVSAGVTSWSTVVPLPQGATTTFTATGTDASGNVGSFTGSAQVTEDPSLGIDSTPPTNVIMLPGGAGVTVDQDTYDVTGVIGQAENDTIHVTIYRDTDDDGTVGAGDIAYASVAIAPGTSSWSLNVPLIQNSVNTFVVQAVDASGNLVDTAVPDISEVPGDTTAPLIVSISLDKASYEVTNDPAVTVTIVEDGTATEVTVDGNSATAAGGGVWTYTFAHPGVVGTYSLVVQTSDASANTDTKEISYSVVADSPADTTAPYISSITLDQPSYEVTNDPNVAVTVIEDDSAASVTINGNAATEGAAGVWTASFAHPGTVGTHSIVVQATDSFGNTNIQTVSYAVVEDDPSDTTAPVINSISLDLGVYRVTQDPNVHVTADEDDSANTVTVNGNAASETGAGVWEYTFAHPGVIGSYSIVVQAIDAVGNTETRMISYTVVDDTSVDPDAPTVIGAGPSGTTTTDSPTVWVELDATDNVATTTCEYNLGGAFSFGSGTSLGWTGTRFEAALPAQPDGNTIVYVLCQDNAGNLMTSPYPLMFYIDTTGSFSYVQDLNANWNVLWIPPTLATLNPEGTGVPDVLGYSTGDHGYDMHWESVGDNWDVLYHWDTATSSWLVQYGPADPFTGTGTLTDMGSDLQNPFWIHMMASNRFEMD
ncbi:hypothetical protein GF351_05815 [Candidatus Woesearchaeota archaeon]|nr:hypothetical protein [Candidatus Woesearchaeota archaeon]